MKCDQFNHRLNVLLDERLLPEQDEALIEHASECPDCRSVLEMQQQLFGCLELREPVNSRSFGVRWSIALTVTAAVLMILTITPLFNNSSISEQPSTSPSEALVTATPQNADLLNEIFKYFPDEYLPDELDLQQSELAESIWLNPMSHSIRPFTESMTSTLNVIRRGWVQPEDAPTSPTPQASRPSTSILI